MNDIRQGTCPLCGHNEIIEDWPQASTDGGTGALYIGNAPRFARLWSYSCRRCDYTQLFAKETAKVGHGPGHAARLIVGPPPAGPFR
jgi:predicted nucleic-acid-binding Zn-ribbon protein